MRGGDRDVAAVAAAREVLPGVAGEQERAREQHRDQPVPAVLGELGDGRDVLEAGVRHHGVEAAERLDRRVDRAAVALARGQVGRVWHAGPVVGRVEVDGEHVEAVVAQALGDRAADAARRSGDDRAA